MSILTTENLTVGYDGKALIEDINISGDKGILLCILGPNGAGKTTILRTLSGLLKKVDGQVYLNDKNLEDVDSKTKAKELSVVLTNRFSGGLMTVYELVSMGRYPHTGFFGKLTKKDIEKVNEALETVNGLHLIHRIFDELSDGEKQKILIARALVQEPDIIVLDEPTTHLDIRHRLELVEILKTLSKEKGISVILSLHEIDIALKSCDRVLLVSDRKIQAYGTVEEVVDEEVIKQLYKIENACYNNLLGSIEIKNIYKEKVFVLAGAGYGIPIYRVLTKNNIGFKTGVLFKNDVDYEIARTMGIDICSVNPFMEIEESHIAKAIDMIDSSTCFIDSGVNIGKSNKDYIGLMEYAIEKNKKIICLREREEAKKIYKSANNIVFIDSICDLDDHIVEIS